MPDSGIATIAITGANGYIGSTLRRALLVAGFRVLALQRSTPKTGDYMRFSLEDGLQEPLPGGVDAVVHCAYDLRARDATSIQQINVCGTKRLIEVAGDVPVVLISSMSAYTGTKQIYGRTKLACEELVEMSGGTSLRLGLVYGGTDGGMIGSLRRLAALPVLPALRPDPYQFTIHADDMTRCVIAALEDRHSGVLGVAHPRRVPFSEIVRRLRAGATARSAIGIPVPPSSVYRALKVAEMAGIRIPFRADSLLGLIEPAPEVPRVAHWAERGITLRDYADGIGQP